MSKKSKVYFFDNDINNFTDSYRCNRVQGILCNESRHLKNSDWFISPSKFKRYLLCLSKGARCYGNYILKKDGCDSYDPKSGVKSRHLKFMIRNADPSRIKAFIFDWDRTLSKFEGIYAICPSVKQLIKSFHLHSQVSVSDIAEYYLGGPNRLHALQVFWKWCQKHRIHIYILSSNPSIGKYPYFFKQLLASVNLPVNVNDIIYRGHKTKYKYIQDMLPNLCHKQNYTCQNNSCRLLG